MRWALLKGSRPPTWSACSGLADGRSGVNVSRVAIVGTGYVGLTTGACFAHLGHEVVCADIDANKIDRLNRGELPIFEAGLDQIIADAVRNGRLRFVLGAVAAVVDCEFAYLCVPTPQGADDRADLSFLEEAAREIASVLPVESIVVNKSTVPVGSTKIVERVLQRPDVRVVSNPEFLREGSAVHDFLHPDRIVIGSEDQAAAIRVASLYLGIPAPLIITDPASAETIKYAANAFLATKISFVNAVAAVCEAVGANVNDVVLGMGLDKRIGQEFLKPGPGWGGSCFPKDTRAMVRIAEDAGYDFDLLKGVIEVNDAQLRRVVAKIAAAAGGSLQGVTVAVWGLTFKANTDDQRESPSIAIVHQLLASGARVQVYDPTVSEIDLDVRVSADPYDACEQASVLAVLTEWDEFRWVDFEKVGSLMATRAVVDGRNLLDRNALIRLGYHYDAIGR
jgi:UDPglucose 6-dehydrogenase